MVRDKLPTKSIITKAAEKEAEKVVSLAVRTIKETLDRVNAEMTEFQKRRARVRERIESGARRTSGRIV